MKITDDMLYHHAEAAREKWLSETLPPQIPEHKFSGKFDRKMRKLIREQRHSAQFNRHIKLLQRISSGMHRIVRRRYDSRRLPRENH